MSNIITARDPGIIAAEINYIKEKIKETVIYASIEIGGKLCEAKSMVSQGEWGRWLEENVEYSQSTAENLMKLYKEYGGNQESLFDTWTNSETFGKLTYTQHLALLALPFADRQEFAEQNSVADMSTRQLQKAIQEQLDEECRRHEETRGNLEATQAQLRDAEQNVLHMQQQLSAAKSTESAWQDEIERLKNDRRRAEQSEVNVLKQLEQAQKDLAQAQAKEDAIREELKIAQENPQVPDSMMEQLRKEAEAQAAAKNKGAATKKLEAAQKELDAAAHQKELLDARIADLEEQLVAAEKRVKMSDPDIMEYNTLAQKLMSDYNVMDGLRRKITVHDKESGEKLKRFQTKVVSMWADSLMGVS